MGVHYPLDLCTAPVLAHWPPLPAHTPRVEMRPAGNKGWKNVTAQVVAFDGARLQLAPALAQTVAMRNPVWRVDGVERAMAAGVQTGPGPVTVRLKAA